MNKGLSLFDEFFRLVAELETADARYCVVGGVAMAVHDRPRFTRDIDVLVAVESEAKAVDAIERLGYDETGPGLRFAATGVLLRRFAKAESGDYLAVDLLVGDDERHRSIVVQSEAMEWAGGIVRVARCEDIIWMKKQRGSAQDAVDIALLTHDED